jgi:prolyl 3-hydroxylase /prolyl 3,4-dihydroxylase
MLRAFTAAEKKQLKKRFTEAKPFPHLLVKNVLTRYTQLLAALKKEKFLPKDTDLFSFKQTNNLAYATHRPLKDFVAFLSSPAFSAFVASLTDLRLQPGAADVFGALYESGDYLLCHDDELEGRKAAFLFYLSPTLAQSDGGGLALLSHRGEHPDQKAVVYPPLENSFILFAVSRHSWHEVEEVIAKRKRYTIGGWLH